jgi:hypothetical protein
MTRPRAAATDVVAASGPAMQVSGTTRPPSVEGQEDNGGYHPDGGGRGRGCAGQPSHQQGEQRRE